MPATASATPPVEHLNSEGFDQTVERLVSAIEAAGLTVFARLDHAEGARAAGLDMPPSLVLVYGHAKGGTPIIQAYPAAALDLPLRMLIRSEAPDRTVVSYHPVVEMLARHGVLKEMAQRLEPAQALIGRALTR